MRIKMNNEQVMEVLALEALAKAVVKGSGKEKEEEPIITLKIKDAKGKCIFTLMGKDALKETFMRAVSVTPEGEVENTTASAKAAEFFGFLHAVETADEVTMEIPNIPETETKSVTGSFETKGAVIGDIRFLPTVKVEPAASAKEAISITVNRETLEEALNEVAASEVAFLLTGKEELTMVGMNGKAMFRRKVITVDSVSVKGDLYKGYLEEGNTVDGEYFAFVMDKDRITRLKGADDSDVVNLLCSDKVIVARTSFTLIEALVKEGGKVNANKVNAGIDNIVEEANKGINIFAFIGKEEFFKAMASIRAVSGVLKLRGDEKTSGVLMVAAGKEMLSLSMGEAVYEVSPLALKVTKETAPMAFSFTLLDIAGRAISKSEAIGLSVSSVRNGHLVTLTPVRKNDSGKGMKPDKSSQTVLFGMNIANAKAKKAKDKANETVADEEIRAAEEESENFITA